MSVARGFVRLANRYEINFEVNREAIIEERIFHITQLREAIEAANHLLEISYKEFENWADSLQALYEVNEFDIFKKPLWYTDGVEILQQLAQIGIESEIYLEKMRILDYTRKKTTQKVNLYEKVQIPGYKEAIRKIKRYMEDEENLSKASQKIVKTRHLIEEEENHD
jgi:hypothetical protein